MNKEQKFIPSGEPTDTFDKKKGGRLKSKSYSTFQTDLYNLALDKDVAKKRNLIYLILIIICVIATVFVTTTASYKTYVVRVNEATGEVQTGGELKVTNYTPQEAEIRHFLAEFILDTRTIPLDPIQYKNGLEGGATGKKTYYVGLFNVGVDSRGQKEAEFLINPLGIKIKDLNISQEEGQS